MYLLLKLCVVSLVTATISFTTQTTLYEGNVCDLHTGEKGICKNMLKCNWVLQNLQSRRMNLSDIRRCSFSGRLGLVVCCGDDELGVRIEEQPKLCQEKFYFDFNCSSSSQKRTTNRKPGWKIRSACAKYSAIATPFDPKDVVYGIVRGKPARLTEFPHVGALGYPNQKPTIYDFDCGASLISEQWAVTAAHCIKERRKPVIIRFGRVYLYSESKEVIDRRITRFLRNEYSILTKKNDIALIEFEEVIEFNALVRPACIRTEIEDIDENEDLMIAGWGSVEPERSNRSEDLLKANVYTVPLAKCDEQLKANNLANLPSLRGLNQSQMCATNQIEGSDACQGDSGGPIFQYNELTGLSTIAGIVSFGISCGTALPGVYTRIASYTEWIESIVWP